MPAWDRSLDLFVNVGSSPDYILLRSKTDTGPAERPLLVSGDKFRVRLWLLLPSLTGSTPPSIMTLNAGDTIILAAKLNAAASSLLFNATGWSEISDSDGKHYEALLDLNTTELAASFGGDHEIFALLDLEVRNNANSFRRTRQFRAQVNKQAYAGEGDPTPAAPVYPAPESLLTNGADAPNLKRGTINLAAGDYQNVPVAFTTEFATPPTTVFAWTMKKAGADIIDCAVNHDNIDTDGFNVDLAATIPDATPTGDYKLQWLALI